MNRLVRPEEAAKVLLKHLKRLPLADQRAMVYELQTCLGGFPASKAERKRYIKTGKPA